MNNWTSRNDGPKLLFQALAAGGGRGYGKADRVNTNEKRNRRWIPWALLFGAATVLGLLFATRTYVLYSFYPDRAITFAEAAFPALTDAYLWALLVPIMVWVVRRYPIEGSGWPRAVLVHVIVGSLIATLKFFMDTGAGAVLPWMPSRGMALPRFIFQFYPNLITYAVIIAIAHAVDYARKFRSRELSASQLEAKLAQVQLQVLRMQLQPHFLFNTLHAISALMHRDADAADRMLVRLSDLLRLTIDKIGVHEVSLKEELEFLRSYLEIEETRFQDRLSVKLDIDPGTLDARVPNLILQPLVENSIRHGLAPRSALAHIEVSAQREDGTLRLTISDNGPGLLRGRSGARVQGMGIANVQARLSHLYGTEHALEFRNRPEGGLAVTLVIPFRVEAADDHHGGGEDQRK